VASLRSVRVTRTGAAHGVDTIAAVTSIRKWPKKKHQVYVPTGAHNEELVQAMAEKGAVIIQCGSYRNRNERMVIGADRLVAFVRAERFYRSGEWMTINIARRAGVPVKLLLIPVGAKLS
jgi:hypothetical protein